MKKTLLSILLSMGILSNATANDNLYMGIQSSFPSEGFSIKMDTSHKVAVQGIFDFIGDETSYALRGLYKFKKEQFYNVYGYGEIGLWSWDKAYYYHESETVLGFGAGAGIEYDLRGLDSSFIPLFVNAELNLHMIDFDYYHNDDEFGLGLGIHYKF
ncbi:MAG TPA: hypothetical protein EYG67_03570 [Campylobacterales bacterium]|nr:hypothetical protein [Campylobacterales bacterium]HIP41761.1 hypothetical protein [Campylobacterales bacterium]